MTEREMIFFLKTEVVTLILEDMLIKTIIIIKIEEIMVMEIGQDLREDLIMIAPSRKITMVTAIDEMVLQFKELCLWGVESGVTGDES